MNNHKSNRRGAVMALLAVVLPVIVLLGMVAINLASMQLARTELKIATDAAARAGGRAWSEHQDQDIARDFAQQAALLNNVNGNGLSLDASSNSSEIVFGSSLRIESEGRFVFSPLGNNDDAISATGIRVNASLDDQLLFAIGNTETFQLLATSVATQIDRDIALVVDRSGSMAYYQDEDELYETITALYEDRSNGISNSEYIDAVTDYQPIRSLARLSLSDRQYSQKVIDLLSGDLKQYAITLNTKYRTGIGGPDHSRWALLEEASEAFFNTLENSDQTELVSVSSFASSGRQDVPLTSDVNEAIKSIESMRPDGSTAIGVGMLEGIQTLVGDRARPDAVPTIIVFSDGENKRGRNPESAARQIKEDHPRVIINTVTFAAGNQREMQAVAEIGDGRHYHAESGDQLIEIFETIAASFRTIITE